MENQGASVVINHHILDGKQSQYEKWLDEIVPVTKHSEGFIDLQIIRPIPDLTFVYTVIIRFDTINHLKNWMESEDRKQLIEKASPLFRKNDHYQIKSGLDFFLLQKMKAIRFRYAGNSFWQPGQPFTRCPYLFLL